MAAAYPGGTAVSRRSPFNDPFSGYQTQVEPFSYEGDTGYTPSLAPGAPPPPAPPPPDLPTPQEVHYGNIQGFDYGKLSDPTYHSDKYTNAARGFSTYLGTGGGVTRGALDPAINWLQANGFKGAKAVGDDKIDFGDGNGPIDVITSNGQTWFQNGADRFGGGGGAAPGSPEFLTSGNAAALGMPSGGGASGGSGQSGFSSGFNAAGLKDALAGLFPGGNFNQDIVNRRTDNIRGAANAQRKSTLQTNQALLADRGLLGSGPEMTAYNNMDENLFNQELSGINDAYANEGQAADQRMMQALQISAGMTAAEAQNAVDFFRAQNDQTRNSNDFALGQGNLALGNRNTDLGYYRAGNDFTLGQGGLAIDNMNAVNGYNMGMANFGLNRDKLEYDMQNGDIDRLMQILQTYFGGAQTSAGGYR